MAFDNFYIFGTNVLCKHIPLTVNLFTLYLVNVMFHTMLDAAGNILRVHYISMKCMFHLHKVV